MEPKNFWFVYDEKDCLPWLGVLRYEIFVGSLHYAPLRGGLVLILMGVWCS